MTVIAWDGKTLAADRQATANGVLHQITKIRKITKGRKKGWLIANAGSAATGGLLMDWFESGAEPKHFPYEYQTKDGYAATLIAISPDGLIHKYEHLPLPIIFEDEFYADGSGKEMALGAMAMGADAVTAIQVVCSMETECGVGIDSFDLKEKSNARARSKGKADKAGAKDGSAGKATASAKRTARPANKTSSVAKKSSGGRV